MNRPRPLVMFRQRNLSVPGRLAMVAAAVLALCGACDSGTDSEMCTIGSVRCTCTTGGACDPGLTCLSGYCVSKSGDDAASDDGVAADWPGPDPDTTKPPVDGCPLCLAHWFGTMDGTCDVDANGDGTYELTGALALDLEGGVPKVLGADACEPVVDFDDASCEYEVTCGGCTIAATSTWDLNKPAGQRGGWTLAGACTDGRKLECYGLGKGAEGEPIPIPLELPICAATWTDTNPAANCSADDLILLEGFAVSNWCMGSKFEGGCGCWAGAQVAEPDAVAYYKCFLAELALGQGCVPADTTCKTQVGVDIVVAATLSVSNASDKPLGCIGPFTQGGGTGSGQACTTDSNCGDCERCSDGQCRWCGYGATGCCLCASSVSCN